MSQSKASSMRFVATACVLFGAATPAAAQVLTGSASTYVRGFTRPTGTTTASYLPLYELIELRAPRLGTDGLSLQSSFWGMIDALDLQGTGRATGDISTFFVQYRVPERGKLKFLRGLELSAGRQLVSLGPTVLEQLDGGKLHYQHAKGFQLGVFGGAPTGLRIMDQSWPVGDDRYGYGYNWLVGGRLGYARFGVVAGGVSYVYRAYHSRAADQDLGWDLSATPTKWLDLTADATLSLETLRLKLLRGGANVTLPGNVMLHAGYSFSAPDLFIPRTSIFAVFSNETWQELNAVLTWEARRRLLLEAGYGRRFYDWRDKDPTATSTGGNHVNARATFRLGRERSTRLILEGERIESPDNAINRARLALRIPFYAARRNWSAIIDVDFYVLDEPLRDTRASMTGAGYLEVDVREGLRLLLGGSIGTTPLMKQEATGMVRLSWNFAVPYTTANVDVRRNGERW